MDSRADGVNMHVTQAEIAEAKAVAMVSFVLVKLSNLEMECTGEIGTRINRLCFDIKDVLDKFFEDGVSVE